MKNYIILSIALFFYILSNAQIVSIPDAAFKNELVNTHCVDVDGDGFFESDVDTNDDGEVQETEAESVLRLSTHESDINSIEGIQSFVNLLEFSFQGDGITSFDITQNTQLEFLDCGYNPITSIDVSQNIHLIELGVYNTSITEIDLSNNPNLEDILVRWNQLTSLDVSNLPNLRELKCNGNQITELDVSNNPNLEYIICNDNQISNLDLSNNLQLHFIYVYDNLLTSLNLQNGFNEIITHLYTEGNYGLNCIQVDDVGYANSQICNDIFNPGWCKDDIAIYSENCELGVSDSALSSIVLYPNPTKNTININTNTTINAIKIYDALGRLILSETHNFNQLNISNLENGLLFVQLETEQGVLVKKVVKE